MTDKKEEIRRNLIGAFEAFGSLKIEARDARKVAQIADIIATAANFLAEKESETEENRK